MGHQLSREVKTEIDSEDKNQDSQDLSLPRPETPFHLRGNITVPSSLPHPPDPEIVFSSQVPGLENRSFLPIPPPYGSYYLSNDDLPSSPTRRQPSTMAPSRQNAKREVPESPDQTRQMASPNFKSSGSKNRRSKNRPSMVPQPPSSVDFDAAPPSSADKNGVMDVGKTGSARKRGKKRRKKAHHPNSPDMSSHEPLTDPVEAAGTNAPPTDHPSGFRPINGTAIVSTPPNASSSKKRKSERSAGRNKKKHKHNDDHGDIADATTSFSGLAESLYAGRKKGNGLFGTNGDSSTHNNAQQQSSDDSDQEHKSSGSPASDANINGADSDSGPDKTPNATSNDEVEVERSNGDSGPNSADQHNDLDIGSSSRDLSNDTQSDNKDEDLSNDDDQNIEDREDNKEDDNVEPDEVVRSSGHASRPRSSGSNATNDERHPNNDELIDGSEAGRDNSNSKHANSRPKSASARKRVAKPTFFEREVEERTDARVIASSSPTARPSKSTVKGQAKISTMLQGNTENNPRPKTPSAKHPATPKKRQPHQLVTGQFSEFELRNITQAVERWRDDHNLTQYDVNALIQGNPREVKSHDFWARIVATCPNRRRQKVINQCRRKFHNFVARGSWTQEQHDELKGLWETHGNKYAVIGKEINRHPEDVRDRIRNYVVCGENRRVDPWTQEEEDELRSIILSALETIRARRQTGQISAEESDEDLIDWQRVSELMHRTRSRLQCMQKWKLMSRDRQRQEGAGSIDGGEVLSIEQTIQTARDEANATSSRERYRLLKAIRASGAKAESRIPWAKIRAKQLGSRWTRPTLMLVWSRLKRSVPDWTIMSVPEVVQQLTSRYRETRELEFPSTEHYGPDAEYSELKRKITKLLANGHRAPKTPSLVVKTDEDNEEEGAEDDEDEESYENDETDTGDERGKDIEEIDESDLEVDPVDAHNSVKQKARHVKDEIEDYESSDDPSDDEDVSMEDVADHSSDSVDLGHHVQSEVTTRESSVDAPSISNFRSQRAQKGQKRYRSSTRVTKPQKSTPTKTRSTRLVIDESSEPEQAGQAGQALDDDELSSNTNASEVESIPARI
ncbi:hypothetical protein GGS26DRAFT_514543 [Hypomontagnella submonticulosa]|nr:hypothetical protein GGS26DRAFT_514543 [Hypomontagnella submonticulosa]